jgi:hypothetical protein
MLLSIWCIEKIGPLEKQNQTEASYGPLVMDSDLQWLLCLILPLTILISQAPSELFFELG